MANLAWWQAEINRDRSQRKEPFKLEDFTFFHSRESSSSSRAMEQGPPAEAGAAMRELIRRQLFPPWALTFYPVLEGIGDDEDLPARLAWIAEDAILLSPRPLPSGGWVGFLIAEDTAAAQIRTFRCADDEAAEVSLSVPAAPERGVAVWAAANASLPIPQSPDTPAAPAPPLL